MNRVLQPELLDELPATDPRAIHSRRDLRRINALMGNARPIQSFVGAEVTRLKLKSPVTLIELGAGDGNIAIQVASHLASLGHSGRVILVDQQPIASPQIDRWETKTIAANVLEWLPNAPEAQIIICNLFLHHFESESLREILTHSARLCSCFAACEPRRNAFALWFARKVWAIGCNDVTCHDADISVRAGFNDSDLASLWPARPEWKFEERRAGLFTHFFGAARTK